MHRILQFIVHWISANNRHGVHSPFVYDLIDSCIYKETRIDNAVQSFYNELKKSAEDIKGMDYGTNTAIEVSVSRLARKSATKDFESLLLSRLVQYHGSNQFLELGGNIGKATGVIAVSNPSAQICSIEGNAGIAHFSKKALKRLKIQNVEVINCTFDEFFENSNAKFDAVFIDGDHSYEPTLKNFDHAKRILRGEGPIILHDIYWSNGMTRAWEKIKADDKATVTIDLFFFGLVYFRPNQAKEHFNIRFPLNLFRLLF